MNRLFLVILAVICFVIYFGYLHNGFVFDDKILVEANPLIKSTHLLPNVFKSAIYEYWTGPQPYDRMYRPLQMVSYYLDYNLWGLNPIGFRLSNLLLHLFNSILVFYLLLLVFKDKLLAQAASILFLAHPAHISSVAYISARGDLLSGFFILTACILFLKFLDSSDYRLYLFSMLAAFFALLSRENALLIIFLFALLGFFGQRKRISFKEIAGFFVLCFVYLNTRFIALGPSGLATHPVYLQGLLWLINAVNIILRYIGLLLWPHDLRMFHSAAFIYKLTIPILSLVIAGIILLVVLFICLRKNKIIISPVLKFSLFWFLAGLIPAYFCFDAYPGLGRALMAESWLYLPSIGFFTAFAYICLLNKKGKLIIFAFVLIFGLMVFTNRVYWRNDVTFYERAIQYLSEDNILQKNLVSAYIQDRDFNRADKAIQKLQKYYPDSPIVNAARGQYYLARGEPKEALNYYQRILVKSFFTNYSVSLCYSKLGDINRAIVFSLKSYNLNAFYLPNIKQLAALYQESGQAEEAKKYSILIGELNPKR